VALGTSRDESADMIYDTDLTTTGSAVVHGEDLNEDLTATSSAVVQDEDLTTTGSAVVHDEDLYEDLATTSSAVACSLSTILYHLVAVS